MLGGNPVHLACREYVSGRTVRKGLFVRDASTGAETRFGDDSHDVERFEAAVLPDGSTAVYYLVSTPDFTGDAEDLLESYFHARLYKVDWRDGRWSDPVAVVPDQNRVQSGIAIAVSGEGGALVAYRDSDALAHNAGTDVLAAFMDDGGTRSPSQVVMDIAGREIPSVAVCLKDGEPRIVIVEANGECDAASVKRLVSGEWIGAGIESRHSMSDRPVLASSYSNAPVESAVSHGRMLSSNPSCGGNCGKNCYCHCRSGGEMSNGCACSIYCSCKGLCSSGACKCWNRKKEYVKPKSNDPNEMGGPSGIGARRCVMPGDWMDYTVYFENKTNATAAAQDVYATLPKDPGLDWTTFELGEIVFGDNVDSGLSGCAKGVSSYAMPGTNWSVRMEVTHDGETVKWHLRIVDPSTFDNYPADPYAGFLPPNDETGRGEGHLRYRVKVKSDAAANSTISASATIVFDTNDPIETDPAWWNTMGVPGAAFAESEVAASEGGAADIRISGGSADAAASVKVYLTWNSAAAADVDLKTAAVTGGTGTVVVENGVGVVNGRDARSPSETGGTPPLLGHRLRRLAALGGYVLPVWTAWQYNWKVEPWKTLSVSGGFVTGCDEKKQKYTTVKATGSATLVPVDEEHGAVFICLTPKGLAPHARTLVLPW